tara:strand:+ start:132443 stop:132700 length:258 start_codon:yes stop_codon:yes gene_type:complete
MRLSDLELALKLMDLKNLYNLKKTKMYKKVDNKKIPKSSLLTSTLTIPHINKIKEYFPYCAPKPNPLINGIKNVIAPKKYTKSVS